MPFAQFCRRIRMSSRRLALAVWMRDVGHSSSSSSALRVAVRLVSSRRRHWNSADAPLRADMALAASLMHAMMSPILKPKDMVRSDLTD